MIIEARKKQVVVNAIKLTSDQATIKQVLEFMGQNVDTTFNSAIDAFESYCEIVRNIGLSIGTLDGVMTASIGDYIIKGVDGEFYPCKPDIFLKTYDINFKSIDLSTLELSLTIKKANLKSVCKDIQVNHARCRRELYRRRHWALRRTTGAEYKRFMNDLARRADKALADEIILMDEIRALGDAICRIREVRRGNSKKSVNEILLKLSQVLLEIAES